MRMIPYNPIDLFYIIKKQKYKFASPEDVNTYIGRCITEQIPCFVGRLGATECSNLRIQEFHYYQKRKQMFTQLCEWSGFFPNDITLLKRFADIYIHGIKNLDIAVPWCDFKGQEYLFKKYCNENIIYSSEPIVFYKREHSWIDYMEEKTLLVIHPFADTIEKQFPYMESIYPNRRIFPKGMKLKTIKAVQTIAGNVDSRFNDWFEALDWMCKETEKIEYDAAIIGCGAYGIPLGSYIKNQGKIAVVIGADVQKIFGIKGSRWRNNPDENEYWVKPSKEETPEKYKIVEDGSYW